MTDSNVKILNSAATTIKNAILNAQYKAAKGVNNIQLTLYYSIGRYISQNSRNGKWGTHAIATISQLLKQDMPGLRGYSETNLKMMRTFYENWAELDPILTRLSKKSTSHFLTVSFFFQIIQQPSSIF